MSATIDEKPSTTQTEGLAEDVSQVEKKALGEDRTVEVSAEDDKRLRRKTDKYVLTILMWIYFLQIYDKSVFGYGNTFGLSTDLNLEGQTYSLASSMTSIASLAWQPFSAFIIVRFPARWIMTFCIVGWGTAAACLAAAKGGSGLLAARFFLGYFEAANIPLFSMLTAHWYRRAEQPMRVCAWFGQNATATIVGGLVSYGFGHVHSDKFYPWQSIYLSAGIITVLSAPIVWYRLPSSVSEARFWADDYERDQAIERLRVNQTGTGNHEFKWKQVLEMFMDPKSWLFAALICIPNISAHIASTFGPTLIKGFGYDKYNATLLNMPYGALQGISIVLGSYAASRFKLKAPMLLIMVVLGFSGGVMIYVAQKDEVVNKPLALVGYYFYAFLLGAQPIIYSWAIANVGGNTKKSTMLSFMNMATGVGQLTGPLLLKAADKPRYLPGIRSNLIAQGVLVGVVLAQVGVIWFYNKRQQARRVAVGKPKNPHDYSMDRVLQDTRHLAVGTGEDRTDWQNEDFVYVF